MKRKRPNRPYIPRKEYRFWLRHDREGDTRLMEFIHYCKQTRQFASKVRDGLRLIWSLSEGNNSVLFELFPHLEEILKPPPAPSAQDSGDLKEQIEIAVQAGVQKAMLSLPSLPAGELVAAPVKQSAATNTIGQGRSIVSPTFDDEDDELSIKTATNQTPNFVQQMLNMMDSDKTFGGKNLTAEANAKSLSARRLT